MNHLSVGELVSHLHGPDAGSGANVENAVGCSRVNRCEVQFVAAAANDYVVTYVETIEFGLRTMNLDAECMIMTQALLHRWGASTLER